MLSIRTIKFSFTSLIILSIIGGLFIWFGIFNVAATEKHWDATTALLEMVRDRSISTRSEGLMVPDLTASEMIARGAPNYAAMCSQCHLAPGVKKTEIHEGLYPQPPIFYQRMDSTRKPQEMFWVIKNGLKLTGMPSWGKYNSDTQIWDMVAFVSSMNTMTPEQYKELAAAGEHMHDKGMMESGKDGHGDEADKDHHTGETKSHHT